MQQTGEFCAHPNAKPWLSLTFDVKSGKDTAFGDVMWCPDCDCGFVRQMPDADQIAAHYDLAAYYTQGAETHMPDVPTTLSDKILTKLAWMVDDEPPHLVDEIAAKMARAGKFIDIGCGNGDLLTAMRDRGFDVVGVDPDRAARDYAGQAGLETHAGTAEDLPRELGNTAFDAIAMTHVLEHCVSPTRALENVRHHLADDGLFYCEVPNCGATYFQRNAQISEMLDLPRHLHFFTKTSLQKLCEAVGLQIIDWRYHGYTRQFIAAWRAWENSIHDRIVTRGETPKNKRRTFANSLKLIMDTAWQAPEKKFDCIGFFATRA